MPRTSTAILLQALGGTYEWVGTDRNAGVWHEGLVCEADPWGPSKASFTLKRSPAALFPDLGAFMPVEITDNGVTVWSGRVSETPTSDGQHTVSVQCDGWQFHLDDDVYQRQYVHTNLADYKDMRGVPNVGLGAANHNAAGQVVTDGNQVYLSWPAQASCVSGAGVAAWLDLGPESLAKRVVATWEQSNNTANISVLCRGMTLPVDAVAGSFEDLFTFTLAAGATGTSSGTFTTGRRYLKFVMYNPGATQAFGEVYVKFTSIKVFADTAYESGDASILTASTVISDALDRGTVLLSPDRSLITPTVFVFPAFGSNDPKTPREQINAVASAQDAITRVDAQRRMVFMAKPTVARFEIGEWSGAPVDDASANSGDDIYNRAIVNGKGADGTDILAQLSASDITVAQPITNPAPTNPSFATNTTGWTPGSGTTITRDTGVFDTTPASGRWERAAAANLQVGDSIVATFTGTFLPGVPYQLTIVAKSTTTPGTTLRIGFGVPGTDALTSAPWPLTTTFATAGVSWTPTLARTGVTLSLTVQAGTPGRVYIDSLVLSAAAPTLIDRRGFRRTKVLGVSNELVPELATQIATTFLGDHMTTPFKGATRVQGRGAIRDVLTGQSVNPSWMLLHTQEMLRLAHRVDPDTGGLWRDGRLVGAKWVPEDDAVELTLDSSRTSFDAMLARLAVVVGS